MKPTPRTATNTTLDGSEVHLPFTQIGGKDEGRRADTFYSATEYQQRQALHGLGTYPAPAQFS
jgi:hypothetical protein